MNKNQLKNELRIIQKGKCAFTGSPLPKDNKMCDLHRIVPGKDGGKYTIENSILLLPLAHRLKHENYRERPIELECLYELVQDYQRITRLKVKISNGKDALERGISSDNPKFKVKDTPIVRETMKEMKEKLLGVDKLRSKRRCRIISWFKENKDKYPIVDIALKVAGVGPITIAYMLVYIDIEQTRHMSSMWCYCGLHVPSHERYIKGVSGGGNQNLRTQLYAFADSQIKVRGAYRKYYDQAKERLSKSNEIVKTREKNSKNKLTKMAWKDVSKGHRHGAAVRKIMKKFLSDWWFVARTLKGLSTNVCYMEVKEPTGGHKTIYPAENGWDFPTELIDKNNEEIKRKATANK